MKRNVWFLTGILGLPLVAAGAYLWATAMMDSMFAYRSPLRNSPPAPGPALGTPVTRRVVFVLIDALRLDTSLKTDVMPVLDELRGRGASAAMHSRPPSFSEPGYTALLTGAWPDINDGPPVNLDYEEIHTFTQDDLFSAAHRAGLHTAVSGYYWFERLIPQEAVDASFYTPGEDAAADRDVVDAALPWLRQDYQLVLIHIDQVDYAGHYQGGPRDPRWEAAAARADDLLGEILASLDPERDTILVLSDHGQIDRGGHGGPEPVTLIEPFVLAGAGIRPGAYPDVQMADVAPTLAVLLGTNLPASGQGRPLTGMLVLDQTRLDAIEQALIVQQAGLYRAYAEAIGYAAPISSGQDVVATAQAAMDEARSARLGSESRLRTALAVILAILPGYLFIVRRDRRWPWLLAGALVYLLLFNLRYAILDGRPYSLSAVDSQEWLIAYTGSNAAAALIAGWLVTAFGARMFGRNARHTEARPPRRAAGLTLDFIWLTLYLLGLPVLLSLAVNGPLVTWTLPEFHTAYLALLSLIQGIIVAALGLLLTGIAAGIGRLAGRRT